MRRRLTLLAAMLAMAFVAASPAYAHDIDQSEDNDLVINSASVTSSQTLVQAGGTQSSFQVAGGDAASVQTQSFEATQVQQASAQAGSHNVALQSLGFPFLVVVVW